MRQHLFKLQSRGRPFVCLALIIGNVSLNMCSEHYIFLAQMECFFLKRRENQRIPLGTRAGTNNKLNLLMLSLLRFEPRPRRWQGSSLTLTCRFSSLQRNEQTPLSQLCHYGLFTAPYFFLRLLKLALVLDDLTEKSSCTSRPFPRLEKRSEFHAWSFVNYRRGITWVNFCWVWITRMLY